jgi:hypothetical protein
MAGQRTLHRGVFVAEFLRTVARLAHVNAAPLGCGVLLHVIFHIRIALLCCSHGNIPTKHISKINFNINQYNETNVMQFSFNLLTINPLAPGFNFKFQHTLYLKRE